MDVTDSEELIYHLIRMGAKGNGVAAHNVGMLACRAMHKLKAEGDNESSENIGRALTAAGYAPRIYRDTIPAQKEEATG